MRRRRTTATRTDWSAARPARTRVRRVRFPRRSRGRRAGARGRTARCSCRPRRDPATEDRRSAAGATRKTATGRPPSPGVPASRRGSAAVRRASERKRRHRLRSEQRPGRCPRRAGAPAVTGAVGCHDARVNPAERATAVTVAPTRPASARTRRARPRRPRGACADGPRAQVPGSGGRRTASSTLSLTGKTLSKPVMPKTLRTAACGLTRLRLPPSSCARRIAARRTFTPVESQNSTPLRSTTSRGGPSCMSSVRSASKRGAVCRSISPVVATTTWSSCCRVETLRSTYSRLPRYRTASLPRLVGELRPVRVEPASVSWSGRADGGKQPARPFNSAARTRDTSPCWAGAPCRAQPTSRRPGVDMIIGTVLECVSRSDRPRYRASSPSGADSAVPDRRTRAASETPPSSGAQR